MRVELLFGFEFKVPLCGDFRRSVGFLRVDTPVAQVRQRNRLTRDGAAHEVSRRHHFEFAVQVTNLGFVAQAKKFLNTIYQIPSRTLRVPPALSVMRSNKCLTSASHQIAIYLKRIKKVSLVRRGHQSFDAAFFPRPVPI